jgi:hypothetical protein
MATRRLEQEACHAKRNAAKRQQPREKADFPGLPRGNRLSILETSPVFHFET